MRVTEIYPTIQGETRYAGLPCTIVRTAGCDLRCAYCDSAYAFRGGRDMSVDEVLNEVGRFGLRFVGLTGGEPMLQPDIALLAERLIREGMMVTLETSGAHDVSALPHEVVRIVDVKTPGSGESHRMRWDVLDTLRPADAVKFVLVDESDYRWAADVVRSRSLAARVEVLFSPVMGQMEPRDLVAWVLRDRMPVRINLQLHKYIWGADARGV